MAEPDRNHVEDTYTAADYSSGPDATAIVSVAASRDGRLWITDITIIDPPAAPRLLDELHPNADRICIHCLQPVKRETYEATDFLCWPCEAKWEDYPLKTTHGGHTP